jgi:deferrochelatase/peroxidase EfeB
MDREDIQSVVLRGYPREGLVRYHLLSFDAGDPRALLTRLVTDVASADEPARERTRRQLALTASGLRGLGLCAAEMAQFPREFRQGMAHPERALALGDVLRNSPEHWEFGGPNTPRIDALWLTLSDDATRLVELSTQYERLFARFGVSFQVQDAIATGEPRAAPRRRARFKRFPLGELVLGEADAIGERTRGPLVAHKHSARPLPAWVRARNAQDLGKNGSYLVLRKWQQGQRTEWQVGFYTDLRRQFEVEHSSATRGSAPEALVRGGAYFFLPSVRALNYLAEGRPT